jgi:glutathione S-transferase
MPLEVHADLVSQPSRAAAWLFALNSKDEGPKGKDQDQELRVVRTLIAKGQHQDEDYVRDLHPFGRVPALRDGDFTLFEGAAIMIYACESRKLPQQW